MQEGKAKFRRIFEQGTFSSPTIRSEGVPTIFFIRQSEQIYVHSAGCEGASARGLSDQCNEQSAMYFVLHLQKKYLKQ